MKKTILLLLFFPLFLSLEAQNPIFEWARNFHEGGSTIGYAVTVGSTGNVFTVGKFGGTVDFDPGSGVFNLTSNGSGDVFISKLNATGDFIWARAIGGTTSDSGRGIEVDTFGNVYVTGRFSSDTIDADPGPNELLMTSMGSTSMFVLKLDKDGNLIWARQVDSPGSVVAEDIAIDNQSNMYITGNFSQTADFDPGPDSFLLTGSYIFILKLNSLGNLVWVKQIESGATTTNLGRAITVDSDYNVYTTGFFHNVADFDPGPATFFLSAIGGQDVFVSKLDANGNFVWAKAMGGEGGWGNSGTGREITVDNIGNVYTTGSYRKTFDFDPGPGNYPLTSISNSFDIFISKLDVSGNFLWAKTMGSSSVDVGYGIDLDQEANVYTTGYFFQDVDFAPGADVNILSSEGYSDIFISKLSKDGEYLWAGKMGGSGVDQGFAIALDPVGNIYSTGMFNSVADFDPGPGVSELTAAGGANGYVHKMRQCLFTSKIQREGTDILCPGDSLLLSATLQTDLTLPENYLWSTGDTTASTIVAPLRDTFYTVAVVYNNGCMSMDTIAIQVHPQAEASIIGDLEICQQDTAVLTASGGSSCLWSNGTTDCILSVSPLSDSAYILTITDNNNCTDSDTAIIIVYPIPETSHSADTVLCPGDTITLSADGGTNYLWSNGAEDSMIEISPTSNTLYTIDISNQYACHHIDSIQVRVGEEYCPPCNIVFPNAFTPDGDGVNDYFRVLSVVKLEVLDFRIYNRWGEVVHNNTDAWDGRYQNKPQPADVYVYMMRFRSRYCEGEREQVINGEVTLIR